MSADEFPDRFIIKEQLGQGGMGVVYLAHDKKLGIDVAVKKIKAAASAHKNAFERFKREFTLLSSLSHPNLIKTYEFIDLENDSPILVMEYIQGKLLSDVIQDNEFTFDDKIKTVIQLANALAYIHSKGIVHRDVKPSNVMLLQQEQTIKLLDFGISRYIEEEVTLTKTGDMVGSPHYAAPEQVSRQNLDYRADIYSFGILCFELFSGQKPFEGNDAVTLMGLHAFTEPPKLRTLSKDLPEWLEVMIATCLKKKVEDRYQKISYIVEKVEDELNL